MEISIYDNLPTVKDFLTSYGLVAKKSLGQNFLTNLEITDKIAKTIPDISEKNVVEIGSGPGALTRAILKQNPKKVIAIELDDRAILIQQQIAQAYPDKLEIIKRDALTMTHDDYMRLTGGQDFYICANLPYNISVPLLIGWLHMINARKKISGMVLMFQKEVANRITATRENHKKDYGRIAVLSNLLCKTEQLFDLSPACFTPSPKITSTVVRLTPRETPLADCDINKLESVVKTLFGNRRKMIRGLIKNPEILRATGVEEIKRAEDLSILEFCKLSQFF